MDKNNKKEYKREWYLKNRDIEQQKKCFHYTNIQPLWAKDNIEKRDKILI